jgi:ribose/xylose/arabinose/galactoside ABC-type transport system permease subunit
LLAIITGSLAVAVGLIWATASVLYAWRGSSGINLIAVLLTGVLVGLYAGSFLFVRDWLSPRLATLGNGLN